MIGSENTVTKLSENSSVYKLRNIREEKSVQKSVRKTEADTQVNWQKVEGELVCGGNMTVMGSLKQRKLQTYRRENPKLQSVDHSS